MSYPFILRLLPRQILLFNQLLILEHWCHIPWFLSRMYIFSGILLFARSRLISIISHTNVHVTGVEAARDPGALNAPLNVVETTILFLGELL